MGKGGGKITFKKKAETVVAPVVITAQSDVRVEEFDLVPAPGGSRVLVADVPQMTVVSETLAPEIIEDFLPGSDEHAVSRDPEMEAREAREAKEAESLHSVHHDEHALAATENEGMIHRVPKEAALPVQAPATMLTLNEAQVRIEEKFPALLRAKVVRQTAIPSDVLQVKILRDGGQLPTVAHPGEDLGYDLYASEDAWIPAQGAVRVPTAVAFALGGYGFLLRDRSSMASKHLFVTAGVIDAGYRGEIFVMLNSRRYDLYRIKKGDKIAQAIPYPVLTGEITQVDELPVGIRSEKGYGSSGR